jgi:hypothetical protein
VLSKTLEAVGRGRLKLTGHNPVEELSALSAAHDVSAGQTDAEYLAGLAAPVQQQPQAPEYQQQQQQYDPNGGYAYPQQQDPYGQQQYPQQDGYPEYAADPYAAQQQGYQDPSYGYVQQPEQPEQPYQQDPAAQQQYGYQQQAALDETSFFDTGMIDLDRLRELEQRRGLG